MTESPNPRRYWSNLKIQLSENEGFTQLYPKTVQLKLLAPDGKMRETDTANTETIFRIIQSIPSSKAEPPDTKDSAMDVNLKDKIKAEVLIELKNIHHD